MRAECDFSKSRQNPYAKQLKRKITIRLDASSVEYSSCRSARRRTAATAQTNSKLLMFWR